MNDAIDAIIECIDSCSAVALAVRRPCVRIERCINDICLGVRPGNGDYTIAGVVAGKLHKPVCVGDWGNERTATTTTAATQRI